MLDQRNAESAASARSTIFIVVLGSVLALAILIVASVVLRRDIAPAGKSGEGPRLFRAALPFALSA